MVLLTGCVLLSLFVGARAIGPGTTLDALTDFDPGARDHIIVRDIRLPRTLLGLAVGAALAVAGVVLQGLTRNPLGAPEVLGITPGAALTVVLAIHLGGINSPFGYVWFAVFGALGSAVVVFLLSGGSGGISTPVRFALGGAVFGATAASWTATVMALDEQTLDEARFWLAGSLAGRPLPILAAVLPVLLLGAVCAALLVRPLDALALGDDVAAALGIDPVRSRLVGLAAVTLLAGGAVAAAGPIAFVGLAVPHVVRSLVGPVHRLLLPGCVVVGPALLLLADVVGRVVMVPLEIEVGIVTAVLGAPVLVLLARRSPVVSG